MISFQPSRRAVHRARVIEKSEVAQAHYKLKLHAPQLASQAQPGQFVHVLTTPNAGDWTFDPLLRRAFSIMSVSSGAPETIEVLFRVEGRGTKILAGTQPQDELDLIGPLGQPFDLAPLEISSSSTKHATDETFHVKHFAPGAIVVGGGVGVPPLVYLSQLLHAKAVRVHAIIGARSAGEVIGWSELDAVCEEVSVTTDDGSRGQQGRVTDLLPDVIERMTHSVEGQRVKPVIYACGPWPMLRAVAQVCARLGAKCQVSLEENMPCGVGVCNGCVVRARQPFANEKLDAEKQANLDTNEIVGNEWSPYQTYRRVCVEGPACWADEIDWEQA